MVSEQIKTTSVGEVAEKTIDKEFTHCFEHGTKAKIRFSIELHDYSPEDFRAILSFISSSARELYLTVARKLSVNSDSKNNLDEFNYKKANSPVQNTVSERQKLCNDNSAVFVTSKELQELGQVEIAFKLFNLVDNETRSIDEIFAIAALLQTFAVHKKG